MTIEIHSRESIEKLIGRGFPERTAVISFYTPKDGQNNGYTPVDYTRLTDRVFQIPLEILRTDQLDSGGLNYEAYFPAVDELAEFVFAAIRDNLNIICQCEDGRVISAGCAAALHEFFKADGVFIFADYRYQPSQTVFHKVYNALWLSGKQ